MTTVSIAAMTSFRQSLRSIVPMTGFWVDRVASRPRSQAFTARHHGWIALVFLVLAVYASLFPFAFQGVSLTQAVAKFEAGLVPHSLDRVDFLANVLLFIPLGYFLLGAMRADRHPRSGSLGAMVAVLGIGAAVSVGVEFAQAYFPLRTPDGNDMLAQFLGTCGGVGAWQCFGPNITRRVRWAIECQNLREQAGFLLFAYVAVLVFLHLLPVDLDCRLNVLWRKCSDGILRVFDGQGSLESRHLWDLIYFLPAGLLAAYLPRRAGRRIYEWRSCLVVGLQAVIAVKAAQLLVRSQRLDLLEVFVGLTGFWFGWLVGCALRRGTSAREIGITNPGTIIVCVSLGIAWYAAAGSLLHESSIDYMVSPSHLVHRIRTMNGWPLLDVYSRNYFVALRELMQQALLFMAGGAVIAMALPRSVARSYALFVTVVVALTALILEVAPATGAPHDPSVTAILCETAGAMAGFVLLRGLVTSAGTSPAAKLNREAAMAPFGREASEGSLSSHWAPRETHIFHSA